MTRQSGRKRAVQNRRPDPRAGCGDWLALFFIGDQDGRPRFHGLSVSLSAAALYLRLQDLGGTILLVLLATTNSPSAIVLEGLVDRCGKRSLAVSL